MTVSNNEQLKIMILCFITATIFWFLNALNKKYTSEISYPVSFVFDTTQNISIVSPLPKDISVELNGTGWKLLSLSLGYDLTPVPIEVENPVGTKVIATASLGPIFRNFFSDYQFINARPDSLYLDIQNRVSKEVKLYVEKDSLNLAPGFKVFSDIVIEPNIVTYTGPENFIKKLPDSMAVFNEKKELDKTVDEPLSLKKFQTNLMEITPLNVHLKIDVDKLIRLSQKVDVEKMNFPPELTLLDSSTTVSFTIQKHQMKELSPSDFKVTANYYNMSRDSLVYPRLMLYPSIAQDIQLDSLRLRVINRSRFKKKIPVYH